MSESISDQHSHGPSATNQRATQGSVSFFALGKNTASKHGQTAEIKDHDSQPWRKPTPFRRPQKTDADHHNGNAELRQPIRAQPFFHRHAGFFRSLHGPRCWSGSKFP